MVLGYAPDLRRMRCPANTRPEVTRGQRSRSPLRGPGELTFAMTAAPATAESWKAQLLRGETDDRIAETVARMLGTMIRESWHSSEMAGRSPIYRSSRS